MKIGQKLVYNGIQCLGFPMEYENITQGNFGTFSHKEINAIDNAGKDAGIDPTIVPADCKVVYIDSARNGNAVFLETLGKVGWADGDIEYGTMMFIHDNYVEDIRQYFRLGKVFKQGETFGDEGTAGFATGNHAHIEIAKGKFKRPYAQNRFGLYLLPNSVQSDKAFFIDGTVQITHGKPSGSGKVMNWKTVKQVFGNEKEDSNKETNSNQSKFVKEKGKFTCGVELLNVRDNPSLKGKVVAQYKKGQSLYYDGYVKNDGYVWVHYISFTGKERWVAVRVISTNEPYGTFK